MLLQATNIIPSTFAGVSAGTIDATKPLEISWQVNGSSPMTAYSITICQNDATSTVVYASEVIALSSPFYGTDYLGNIQRFQATPIPASVLTGANIVNGYESGYKLYVNQYTGSAGNYSGVYPLSPAYFITRLSPTVSIDSLPATVATKKLTLTATAQNASYAEKNSIEWVQWEWALAANTDEPFYDTGKIYGTSQLQSSYDGLFSGNTYAVRCTIYTECGQYATTGWKSFNVEYTLQNYEGAVSACNTASTNAVTVKFPGAMPIMGVASGNYTISNMQLVLPALSSVTWNKVGDENMSFAAAWSFVWEGNVPAGKTATAFTITTSNGTISAVIDPAGVTLSKSGTVLAYFAQNNFGDGMYTIVLQPGRVDLKYMRKNGVYPSETLYPNDNLYPSAGDTSFMRQGKEITYTQGDFEGVVVQGEQTINYLWTISGEIEQSVYDKIMGNDSAYKPLVFDGNTYMLASFANGLNAGAILFDNVFITNLSVYRRRIGDSVLRHIADLPADATMFRDYGATNGNTYIYYVFPSTKGTSSAFVTSPIVSNAVTPCNWTWALLECEEDSGGFYHVQREYAFGCNLSSGDISNGNNPSWLTNFTKYQTRQPVTVNALSGTLTSYIGKVNENGEYEDTNEQVKALYALSTSTKPKFLKDRKGNLYNVEISAEIQMSTFDNSAIQAKTIRLSWREVGDATNVSIITTQSDEYFSLGE